MSLLDQVVVGGRAGGSMFLPETKTRNSKPRLLCVTYTDGKNGHRNSLRFETLTHKAS